MTTTAARSRSRTTKRTDDLRIGPLGCGRIVRMMHLDVLAGMR